MGFSPIWDPQDFFQKLGSVTFVPLLCFNLLQNIRKSLWTLEKAKDEQRTNQWTMDMGDYIRSLQVKQGPKRQKSFYNQNQKRSEIHWNIFKHKEHDCKKARTCGKTLEHIESIWFYKMNERWCGNLGILLRTCPLN